MKLICKAVPNPTVVLETRSQTALTSNTSNRHYQSTVNKLVEVVHMRVISSTPEHTAHQRTSSLLYMVKDLIISRPSLVLKERIKVIIQ
jgi:hypothetical protein